MSGEEAPLSEYEELRLAHMRRNHEYLVKLGLKNANDPIAPNGSVKRKLGGSVARKKKVKVDPSECRRSARLANIDVEYTGQALTEMSEAEEHRFERQGYQSKDEVREATMAHLREVREAVLPVVHSDWHAEACRRWGDKCQATDWKTFVETRLSTPPPVSPLDFLQEYYAADTWRLLVSCILMSRVSSWTTKHTCISNFFKSYPTPTAFANEPEWSNVKAVINPLGLFDDRLKSLVALTNAFLNGHDAFDLATDRKSPHKIHGIGPFAVDSFNVFCRDKGSDIILSPGGKPIAPFVAWRKLYSPPSSSSSSSSSSDGGGGSPEEEEDVS